MFLSRRSTQAEYFDTPGRSFEQIAEDYRLLNGINRLFWVTGPFQQILPRRLGRERIASLSLLDLGAGDGSLGRALRDWAAGRGWQWRVTSLDINPLALRLNQNGASVAGSVLALPFRDASFDVVIASQMTHHLDTDRDTAQHFKEAWRVARQLVCLSDLHRNIGLYSVLWAALHTRRLPADFRADGLLSVKRGWRAPEWRKLALQAGIPQARVSLFGGARIILDAMKDGAQTHALT